MPRFDTGRFVHRPSGAMLVSCVVAATLAAAPNTAQAAVPQVGAWESGSRSDPRVSFDVQGPARGRTVQRVSFPIMCKDDPSPVGWGATRLVRLHSGERFTAYNFNAVIRGRFTAKDRAEITVRAIGFGDCKDTRRYVVRHRGRRMAVRAGYYLSLVGGTATVSLETNAFGRMVRVVSMGGSVPSGCSDGSQRPLTLSGPQDFVLAAPIVPSGRFDISAAAGSSITIAGTFAGGSLAAGVDLSVVLPDGTRCTSTARPLVGSLVSPEAGANENEVFPGPPVLVPHTG